MEVQLLNMFISILATSSLSYVYFKRRDFLKWLPAYIISTISMISVVFNANFNRNNDLLGGTLRLISCIFLSSAVIIEYYQNFIGSENLENKFFY